MSKKRQRIILENKTARQQRGAKPVMKNSTPPPRIVVEPIAENDFPYAIIGGIVAVGLLLNGMVWMFVYLMGR